MFNCFTHYDCLFRDGKLYSKRVGFSKTSVMTIKSVRRINCLLSIITVSSILYIRTASLWYVLVSFCTLYIVLIGKKCVGLVYFCILMRMVACPFVVPGSFVLKFMVGFIVSSSIIAMCIQFIYN